MPAALPDSAIYGKLMGDAEIGRLFTDAAEVRALLLVEGALARAQGAAGVIPELSGTFIHRAAMEVQIDPAGLAEGVAESAVIVPALVAAFRKVLDAPEHAPYVHWGATSQDIMDTALALRLRQAIAIMEARLARTIGALGTLAETHAETPMAGRSYGQIAVPTGLGAMVADWGRPLLRHAERLEALKPRLLRVQLAGAAGNLSAMDQGPAIRAALAQALGLHDPGGAWHAQRDSVAEFAAWLTGLSASLAKMGHDMVLLTQTGIGELRLASSGGSSTMPQKQNPVLPSVLVALGRHAAALNAGMQGAAIHGQQRDGAAWFTEWLALPQLVIGTGRALAIATELAEGVVPDAAAMRAGLDPDGLGLIGAEALSFALARHMPRPEAQAEVKALCKRALAERRPLPDLAAEAHPEADLAAAFDPARQLGTAPDEARAFARAAREAASAAD